MIDPEKRKWRGRRYSPDSISGAPVEKDPNDVQQAGDQFDHQVEDADAKT